MGSKRRKLEYSFRSGLRKCDKRSNSVKEDAISRLPDEILVLVLSLLTIKEAIATSVLARRWRYLWTYRTGSLDFDGKQMLEKEDSPPEVYRRKFIDWVNYVLELYQGNEIDKFRICFDLDESCSNEIDDWIQFAFEKRVQRLELNLLRSFKLNSSGILRRGYNVAAAEKLPFKSTSGVIHSLRITSLILCDLKVTEVFLHYILVNSPCLEQLCVRFCSTPKKLKIIGPSLKLKHLELYDCPGLEDLRLSAANLVSFVYSGRIIRVPFEYVPLLSQLVICSEYAKFFLLKPEQHKSYLPQLEKLEICVLFDDLELSASVKRGDSLLRYGSLIKACPLLSRFVLKLLYYEEPFPRDDMVDWIARLEENPEVTKEAIRCRHKRLKVIEYIGFYGYQSDIELSGHLIEIAVSLEKMKITVAKEYGKSVLVETKDFAAQLERILPPGAKIVICI